jgi:heat shock protein HslJ
MRNFAKIAMLASVMALVAACGSTKETTAAIEPTTEKPQQDTPAVVPPKAVLTETAPSQLSGKKWQLKWMSTADISKVDYQGTAPFVTFDTEKMTINGNSGCNNFGGNTELGTNIIKVGMLFSTKKYCEGIPEPEFLRCLENCKKYEVVNSALNLYDASEQLMMTFTATPQ